MPEPNEEEEPRKTASRDYYAGYFWGNHPYESYEMPGRKSDNELKSLRTNNAISPESITISVANGAVILTGHVKTYRERRLIGQEVWNTCGVVKVLNDLYVIQPETAGSREISEESE